MFIKKSIKFAFLLGSIALSTIPINSHAGQGWINCPPDKFCLWQHPKWEGMLVYSSKSQSNLGIMDDRATGLWNRTKSNVCIYQYTNFGGHGKVIPPGYSNDNMKGSGYFTDFGGFNWNDRISSFSIC